MMQMPQIIVMMKKKRLMATFVFWLAVGWLSYLGICQLSYNNQASLLRPLGFFVVLSALLPSIIYLWKLMTGKVVDPIPFLPLVGIIYAIYYGMPAMADEPLQFRLQPISLEVMVKSYQIALAGWWALIFGFYFLGKLIKVKPFLFLLGNSIAAKKTAIRFVLIGFCSEIIPKFVSLPSALGQLPLLLNNFLPLGFGILIILSLQGDFPKGSLIEIFLWVLVLPLFLLLKLSSGLLGTFIFPVIFIFILFWVFSPKLHYVWVCIILLPILILLKGSIAEYRAATWYGEKQNLSSFEKSQLLIEITKKRVLSMGLVDSFEESKKGVKERASQIVTLMRVIDQTPRYIPYLNGETYRTFLYTLIPRVIWPSKPVKDLGQRFGHLYGFLDENDSTTSINFPQLTEFYANFGYMGVLIGMLIVGSLYRVLYQKLNQPWSEKGTLLTGAFIFTNLMNIENDLSMIFCMAFYQLIALFFARKFIKSKS
jgi:hypothetical protein